MNEINYLKTIKKLYADDTSRFSDTIQTLEKTIDETRFKPKEERSKVYLLKARDIIMKIYVP